MRIFAGLLITALLSTAAMAADAPATASPPPGGATNAAAPAVPPAPPLLPVTLTPDDLNSLNTYLQAQPYSFSATIMELLVRRENEARAAAPKK